MSKLAFDIKNLQRKINSLNEKDQTIDVLISQWKSIKVKKRCNNKKIKDHV